MCRHNCLDIAQIPQHLINFLTVLILGKIKVMIWWKFYVYQHTRNTGKSACKLHIRVYTRRKLQSVMYHQDNVTLQLIDYAENKFKVLKKGSQCYYFLQLLYFSFSSTYLQLIIINILCSNDLLYYFLCIRIS